MNQKLKRAGLCLFGILIVQAITLVYTLYWKAQFLSHTDPITQANIHLFDFSTAISVLIMGATVKCALELKKENPWAWAGALLIFLLSLGSFAIPAGVYGLLMILHRDVRLPYWNKLQIAIDAI